VGRKTREQTALRPTRSPQGKRLGRRTVFSEKIETRLCEYVEDRIPITTAATLAGIGQSTLFQWLRIAEDAREQIDAWQEQHGAGLPPDVDDSALRLVQFAERIAQARAKSEAATVKSVAKAIDGGYLVSEEPALNADGMPIYNEDGELAMKRRWAEPDGKLGLEFLSRSHPDRWGKQGAVQVEISGPGGAPVQVEQGAQIASIAERLAQTRLAIEGGEPGDGIEDAEVVDGVLEEDEVARQQVREMLAAGDAG
jgi:hypothetical protein